MLNQTQNMLRDDFDVIANWVHPNAKVLDLGCGDGALLRALRERRNARGYGIEIADDNIIRCIANNVNVIQMDLESGLSGFEAASFDFVILSQTLQAMKNTEQTMLEMLRVGKQAIVTFPNFGHWSHRLQVIRGAMPVSDQLPYQWYDTPNIHLCTLNDFESFCVTHAIRVLERRVMSGASEIKTLPNLRGNLAIYRVEKAGI